MRIARVLHHRDRSAAQQSEVPDPQADSHLQNAATLIWKEMVGRFLQGSRGAADLVPLWAARNSGPP